MSAPLKSIQQKTEKTNPGRMATIRALNSVREGSVHLCALWQSFNGEHISPSRLERRIAESYSTVLVIEHECSLLGFSSGTARSSILRSRQFFDLEALYVTEHLRRHGWGKQLIAATKEVAFGMGCESIHVSVVSTSVVREFYTSQGFIVYADRCILKL